MAKKPPLDPKTPHWFDDWHNKYFDKVDDRTRRNEKWIYIIITAIIATGVMSNGNTEEIVNIIMSLIHSM